MATWFQVWGLDIEPVEIERDSEQCIYIGGRRKAKRSDYLNYFPTREEAVEFLMAKLDDEVAKAKNALERAEAKRGRAAKKYLG